MISRMVRDKGLPFDVVADLLGITVDEVRSYGKSGRLETC